MMLSLYGLLWKWWEFPSNGLNGPAAAWSAVFGRFPDFFDRRHWTAHGRIFPAECCAPKFRSELCGPRPRSPHWSCPLSSDSCPKVTENFRWFPMVSRFSSRLCLRALEWTNPGNLSMRPDHPSKHASKSSPSPFHQRGIIKPACAQPRSELPTSGWLSVSHKP